MKRVVSMLLMGAFGVGCTGEPAGNTSSGSTSSSSSSSGMASGGGSSGRSSSGGGGSSGRSSSGGGGSSSSSGGGVITRAMCLPTAGGGSSGGSNGGSSGAVACGENAANEPNNTAATATVLTLTNNAVTVMDGSCEANGEINDDFFKVTVPAGAGLRLTLSSPTTGGEDLDLLVTGATDGAFLGGSFRATMEGMAHPNEVVQLTQLVAQTEVVIQVQNYGILLGGFINIPAPTPYTLAVEVLPGGNCAADQLEPNDAAGMAKNWPLTQADMVDFNQLPITACPGNADFHNIRITNAGPAQVRIKSQGTVTAEVTPAAGGAALGTGTTVNGFATVDFTASAMGQYVLKVDGAVAPGTDYDIQFTKGNCAAETPVDDTTATAQAYPVPTSVTLKACQDNADYLKFTTNAVAGQLTLTVAQTSLAFGELRAIVFTAGMEASPVATTGAVNATTGVSTAMFMPAASTEYFVKVTNVGGIGDTEYDIGLSGLPLCNDMANEPNDTPATAVAIMNDETAVQTLCGAANADHFKFTTEYAGMAKVAVRRGPADAVLNVTITQGANTVTATSTTDGDTVTYAFTATAATEYVVGVVNPDAAKVVQYIVSVEPPLPPPPANDSCAGAITLSANQTVSGNTLGATNDVNVDADNWCIGFNTSGPDVVYSVTIPAGQTLTAELTTTSDADQQLLLLDGCNTACCWAGVDDGGGMDGELLQYRNSTAAAQTLFLVVDGYGGDAGDFGLTVAIQ